MADSGSLDRLWVAKIQGDTQHNTTPPPPGTPLLLMGPKDIGPKDIGPPLILFSPEDE